MTHARILALDTTADPIHAAIERHRTAYDAYQVAPEGEASMIANDDYDTATDALINYASWLFMERRMVCRELYPQMGARSDRFVLSANAAEKFH